MREHHPFRQACRPARVRQRNKIFRIDVDVRGRSRHGHELTELHTTTRLIVECDDVIDRGAFYRVRPRSGQRSHRDQDARARIGELSSEVVCCVERTGRRRDRAEACEGQNRDRVLDRVGAEDGARVALAQSEPRESRRGAVHQLRQLTVGDRASRDAVHQRRPIAPGSGAGEDEIRQRRIRNVDVGVGAAVDHAGILHHYRGQTPIRGMFEIGV